MRFKGDDLVAYGSHEEETMCEQSGRQGSKKTLFDISQSICVDVSLEKSILAEAKKSSILTNLFLNTILYTRMI